MKTLYLLRHAKAEPAKGKEEDAERRLSDFGRASCKIIGNYMKEKGYFPSFILCSPARRTTDTCNLTMEAAGVNPPRKFDNGLYAATAERLINHLRLIDDDITSAMLVGHNPGIHTLALTLAHPADDDMYGTLRLKYPPGSLTVLHIPGGSWQDVRAGAAGLVDFMTLSSA